MPAVITKLCLNHDATLTGPPVHRTLVLERRGAVLNTKHTFTAKLAAIALCALATTGVSGAAAQTTQSYTYDVHGRLTAVSQGTATSSYAYDAADNRTARVRSTGGGSELTSITFTASSNYLDHYSGLTTPGGMRDGDYLSNNSTHGTNNSSADQWVKADLGTILTLDRIDVAPINTTHPDAWGPYFLNGAVVEYSTNSTSWTTAGTVSGAADGVYASVSLSGVNARFVRLRMPATYLGVGDFRVFN